jgi:hypothetical protein
MTSDEIAAQLAPLASAEDDVVYLSYGLTAVWTAANVGNECVEPILRFMEEHPDLDYGTPGPLVHLVERFNPDYEEKLIESVGRRPMDTNVWMLCRLLNGTEEPAQRGLLLQALAQATIHPLADQYTLERIREYLAYAAQR